MNSCFLVCVSQGDTHTEGVVLWRSDIDINLALLPYNRHTHTDGSTMCVSQDICMLGFIYNSLRKIYTCHFPRQRFFALQGCRAALALWRRSTATFPVGKQNTDRRRLTIYWVREVNVVQAGGSHLRVIRTWKKDVCSDCHSADMTASSLHALEWMCKHDVHELREAAMHSKVFSAKVLYHPREWEPIDHVACALKEAVRRVHTICPGFFNAIVSGCWTCVFAS